MSVGSLGLLGSVAGAPMAQSKGSDIDKAKADANHQLRAVESAARADAAAGVGVTQGDSETSDRDADGRRIWELPPDKPKSSDSSDSTEGALPLAKDPTGQSGTHLDLRG